MSSVVETSHEISWTSQATSRFRTSYSMFPRSLRSFENIPHEEVFRGMQIL